MTFWLIYLGSIIFHYAIGGKPKAILLGFVFNNAILLFAPLHYLDAPKLESWVEYNRTALSVILSLILAYYILKGLHLLGEFYQK